MNCRWCGPRRRWSATPPISAQEHKDHRARTLHLQAGGRDRRRGSHRAADDHALLRADARREPGTQGIASAQCAHRHPDQFTRIHHRDFGARRLPAAPHRDAAGRASNCTSCAPRPTIRAGAVQSAALLRHGNYGLHAKLYTFDRSKLFIGSMNFDQRSAWLNTEIGLIIDSDELTLQAVARYDAMTQLDNAYEVSLRTGHGRASHSGLAHAQGRSRWSKPRTNPRAMSGAASRTIFSSCCPSTVNFRARYALDYVAESSPESRRHGLTSRRTCGPTARRPAARHDHQRHFIHTDTGETPHGQGSNQPTQPDQQPER